MVKDALHPKETESPVPFLLYPRSPRNCSKLSCSIRQANGRTVALLSCSLFLYLKFISLGLLGSWLSKFYPGLPPNKIWVSHGFHFHQYSLVHAAVFFQNLLVEFVLNSKFSMVDLPNRRHSSFGKVRSTSHWSS